MDRSTVLLVDDTPDHLDLYEMALSERYSVLRARHADQAYLIAVNRRPDAIVANGFMATPDGRSLSDQLKSNPDTASIPIVPLRKPCSLDHLFKSIEEALAARRAPPLALFGVERTGPMRTEQRPIRGRVLVVDDDRLNVHLLTRLLETDGHEVQSASNGEEALQMVADERPDLILMDVLMPRRDGFETCRLLKQNTMTRLIPIVLVTALTDGSDKLTGLEAGADDFLTKPVNAPELRARVRSLLRLKRFTDDLESAEAVMLTLSETIEARNAYTVGHCERLADYAVLLGKEVNLGDQDLAVLEYGGYLHDIGKIGIPDAVLLKPAKLTSDEYELLKQHTLIGDRLCKRLRSLDRVRAIVRHHHERLDGSGYPDRLHGDGIPLVAQIISIVDVYDALTTERPYKSAISADEAYEELRAEAERGWRRRDLVDAFIKSRA